MDAALKPPRCPDARPQWEHQVLTMPSVMSVDAGSIDVKDFEGTDVVVLSLMKKAKAREERALAERNKLQRACMWETIVCLHRLVAAAEEHRRKEEALLKLKAVMMPLVMRRIATKAKLRRRFVDADDCPPRPAVAALQRSVSFMSVLPHTVVAACAQRMEIVAYAERELIVKQGAHATDLYVIALGSCLIDSGDAEKRGRIASVGETFGTVLDVQVPYAGSVFAQRQVTAVWKLTSQAFHAVIASYGDASTRMAIAKCAEELSTEIVRTYFPINRALISRSDVLRRLRLEDSLALAATAEPRVFHRGDVLYTEGTPSSSQSYVYLCVGGALSFRRSLTDVDETVRCGIEGDAPNDYIVVGHMPHIMAVDYDATCTVASDTAKCWAFPRRDFMHAMLPSPAVIIELRNHATAERLRNMPRLNREAVARWHILHHVPVPRLERLIAHRAAIATRPPEAFLTQPEQTISAVFIVVSGTVSLRRANQAKTAAPELRVCVPNEPSTWTHIGSEFEALGLVESWRDTWQAETTVDFWALTLRDIRAEYASMTVEHQQRALNYARKDMMQALRLTTLPKAVLRPLEKKAGSNDPSPSAPELHVRRSDRSHSQVSLRLPLKRSSTGEESSNYGPSDSPASPRNLTFAHSSTGQWISNSASIAPLPAPLGSKLPRRASIYPAEVLQNPADSREEEFNRTVAQSLYQRAEPVSATARGILRDLDTWDIHPLNPGKPAVHVPLRGPHTARANLASLSQKALTALAEGRDPVAAAALVDTAEPRLALVPAAPPPRVASARHRWPAIPARRPSAPMTRRAVVQLLAAAVEPSRPPAVAESSLAASIQRGHRRYVQGVLFDVAKELV
jgi:CRP-like cAMP-binding protein